MDNTKHPSWNPPKVDKRTKSYKEYKEAFERNHANDSKGLGDTIEKITTVTGIKAVVEALAGKECGCDERKERLNDKIQYKVLQCPTEEMYNTLANYFEQEQRTDITGAEQNEFNAILSYVFQRKYKRLGCCYGGRLNVLKELYLENLN